LDNFYSISYAITTEGRLLANGEISKDPFPKIPKTPFFSLFYIDKLNKARRKHAKSFSDKVIADKFNMKSLPEFGLPHAVPRDGNVKDILSGMLDSDRLTSVKSDNFHDWRNLCDEWKMEYPPVGPEHKEKIQDRVNSYIFIDKLSEILPDNCIIVTDMGTSLTCTHAAFRNKKNQRIITSTGLGEMGYGLPAAVGACVAAEDTKTPVIFLGVEGSLQMNIQELTTAVIHKLPIKIAVLNNCFLGMVRQWQELLYEKRYSATNLCANPDLCKVAEAFGVADIKAAFEKIAPQDARYEHEETWHDDNGHSHVRAALLGPSLSVPVVDGRLTLGTWQQIILVDFDTRPRTRTVICQIIGE